MLILRYPTIITCEVLYYRPDFPSLVQSFVWQTEDTIPELKRIHQFLHFWQTQIEARINSIRISHGNNPTWRNITAIIN